jgi:hypothetical protein
VSGSAVRRRSRKRSCGVYTDSVPVVIPTGRSPMT